MFRTALFAIPMMFAWVVISGQLSWQGLVVGYIFGYAIILLLRVNTPGFDGKGEPINLRNPLGRLVQLVVYVAVLTFDVAISGLDVARRVLQTPMDIKPGIYRISTQDEGKNRVISALSAHAITITPGELVIDYDGEDDGTMLIHVLDRDASTQEKLEDDQRQRLKRIKGILGLS